MPPTDPMLARGHAVAGRYRIVRLLGVGGMGEVYEAENIWTGRRVALKALRTDAARDPGIVQRFLQEGRSTTMIAHPNVVEVLDMGRDDADGLVYMVQEYLTGVGLDKLLARQGKLSVRDALDIIVPIMGGLAVAHRRAVVHRDVKPENIVLAQGGAGNLIPKLIDFGVAKLLDSGRQPTHPGMLIGTPRYMSPEQVGGAALDPRTDVWSVGVVFYEVLCGVVPFDGDGLAQICASIRALNAPRLEQRTDGVPPELADVIHRALRAREQRYDSMEVFIEALLGCKPIESTTAALLQRHQHAIPYLRRHPRYPVAWSCRVACPDWETARRLVSANVSQGGAFVPTDRPPAAGTAVRIEMQLPDGTTVRLKGVVVRSVGCETGASGGQVGFAVRFDTEHDTALAVLEQVAAAHQDPGYVSLPQAGGDAAPAEARATLTRPKSPARKVADPTPARAVKAVSRRIDLAGAVGIDFGTTYTSISIALANKVYPIPDGRERLLHPSIVAYPRRGQPVVGWDARSFQLREPQRTLSSVKRVLGRKIDEPMIQGYLHDLPYRSVRGPDDGILFQLEDSELAPVQVAAEVIGFARRVAEARTGRPVTRAVLSVPLTFTQAQRGALERAVWIAGLETLELIGEPVAAVLAYGFGQQRRETVAVYDFGGGTFDFSLLELRGDRYRVLGSGGDPWLGGDDFDAAIAQEAANRFWRETKVDLRQRAVEWQRLLFASEQAKRALSGETETELLLRQAIAHPRPVDLRWRLTRGDLEQLCAEAFNRSMEICQRTLASVGVPAQRVDRVVITGGTSRIPFVQRELTNFFGKEVSPLIDPELSVCIGTGLRAAVLTEHQVQQAAHRRPLVR